MPYLSAVQIKQEAHHKWVSILTRCGVPVEYLQNKHGECPLCGGHDVSVAGIERGWSSLSLSLDLNTQPP